MGGPGSLSAAGESLEDELHAELYVAGIVSLRRHQTKCSGIARIQTNTVAKIWMIEGIDRFRAKLQPCLLSKFETLRDREVDVQERLVAHAIQRRRDVSQAGIEIVEPDDSNTVNERNLES